MPDARALLSLLITKYLAQPLGECPGMTDIAGMVTGKRYNGGAEAFCQCEGTLVHHGLSPGTSAGQHDLDRCPRKRGKVQPVAANGWDGVLEERLGIGGRTLHAYRREFDAWFPPLVGQTVLCCDL